jgi:16S rRNA processing protein RimM
VSEGFYLVGRVRRAHGIRGELVVESLTDEPDAIFASGRRVFVGSAAGDLAKPSREMTVVRSSELMRGHTLLVPESEISPPDEGELFLHDLVGMRVVHANGAPIGEVVEVFELPQGLVIDVRREGGTVMLPFDDHTVTGVDAAARIITVDPVEGLLD